ncbi:MAG: GAF domain-containing protein [Chloroflexia bacterium]|nr:GAF domain-containing protein [Chloroflexia bacterium]
MGRLLKSWLKTWFVPAEDVATSERLAVWVRLALALFVLALNFFFPPYVGEAVQQVNYTAFALLGVSVILLLVLWRWKRFPLLLSVLLQLGDIFFVFWLLYLAPAPGTALRSTPYDKLFYLIILSAALRFGFLGSFLVSLAATGSYAAILLLIRPLAFPFEEARNLALITQGSLWVGIGLFGGLMAQTVRRVQRRHELERRRSRELEVVQRVANSISATLELDRLMEQAFRSLQQVIPFAEGEITLWEGADGCLVSRSLFTPEGYIRREMRYAPGEGYSGWMVVHRQPLWIPDVKAEQRVRPKDDLAFTSYLGVPLLLGDRLVGTLELSSPEKNNFSREDQEILMAAMPQIAAMLDHARLYDQVRQRLERRVHQLSAIEQIDRELSGTLDLDKVIQFVLDHAMEFTGAEVGALMVVAEQQNGMRVLASRGYPESWAQRFLEEGELWPLDEGITGRVVRTNRPVLLEDVSLDPDYADSTGKTGSELAVPISMEQEVLGVLNLESAHLAAFDEEGLDFVQHLAEHAAIAMQNARMFSRERQRARELAALQEISLELSQQLNMGDILRSVVEWAVQLLDASMGGVYLLEGNRQFLELVASHNLDPQYTGTRLQMGEGMAGRVAQSREPLLVDDYSAFGGRSEHYEETRLGAVIAVPLFYGEEVLGVLDVLHEVGGPTFGERDLQLLLPLANQAAVAIANARLFQETRRSAEQMSNLQAFSQMLGQALGFQETMSALIQGLQRLIPYSGGEICLYDADRQLFVSEVILGQVAEAASAQVYTLEEGYTGWLGRQQQPLLIEDCINFEDVRPKGERAFESGEFRSYLGAPMMIGDRLIGTLELVGQQVGSFTQDHLRLISLVARQAAVAIDNARLYELTDQRLHRRIDQMIALQRIGQEMNTTLELEHNLKLIVEQAIEVTPSTHGNIAMYDESVGAFRVTSAYMGYSEAEARLLRQLRLGRGRSMVDDVLRSGQPDIVTDAREDSRPISVHEGTASALSVPILYEGRVTGVINLLSADVAAYGEEDLQFAQTLAMQASLAVGNARRHSELVEQRELVGQRANQLREILDIGNTLRADRDLSDLLDQVAYGVVGSVGFGLVLFSIVSERDPEVLERVACAGIPLDDFQRMQESRPPKASYEALFQDEFRISRSYFIPEESGLSPQDAQSYVFPGMEFEEELSEAEWHPHDMLLVPMYSSAGDLLGVMSLDNPFDGQRPARRGVEALEIFANQAAIAVENAHLFKERERRIAELNVLNRIGQATASTLDLDAILLAIYERLAESRVLDVESFYIAIYDAEREILRFHPVVDRAFLYDPQEGPVQGMAGWVVQHRQPLLLENIGQAVEEGAVEFVDLAGWDGERTRSYVGVPVLVGDELIGVMAAQSYQEARYGQRELDFLLTVSNQVAVAIQNARLFREREQRLAELAILNEISRILSSSLDLQELLEAVHEQVSRVFDTTNFHIALYDPGDTEWNLAFCLEHGERQPQARYSITAGLTGYIIRERERVLLRTVAENEDLHHSWGQDLLGDKAKSWLGVPLVAADKVVGVMAVQSYQQERLYDEQDLTLFSTIAAQAAIAIDNARLFAERERRITELSILNEIGRELSSALDLDQVTQAIYEQVGRILDTTNFYVALHDEDERIWETVLDFIANERQPPMSQSVDEGLTGYLIRNRQPLLFGSQAELNVFHEQHDIDVVGQSSRCWMGVPMIAADRVIGVVAVESYTQEYAFDRDDLAFLSTVAGQAAVAIDNARLFGETRRRLRQVNTLLEVSRDVAMQQQDLSTLLQSILASAVESVAAAERGSILLLDEEQQDLAIAAQIGYPSDVHREIRFGLEEGFVGWVCREGQADLVRDARRDPRFKVTDSAQDVLAIMSAPLIGRRGLVGVINLDNRTTVGAFSQEDLEFLSGLAHQAAVAIENARLFEERERQAQTLQARVRELSALLEGTQAITSTLELQQVLETLVGVVSRQMDVSTVALWLMEGQSLLPKAFSGLPQEFKQLRRRLGEGLSGQVASSGKTLSLADVMTLPDDEHRPSSFDQELGLHAYLGVPVTYQQRVLGVLSVMSQEAREFDREEVALLTGLAEQAGIAVENARLFAERERRIAELSALNEVSRAISSTMRLDDLLMTIREEAGRLVDTSNFMVSLYDQRTDTVSFPVYHEHGHRLEMRGRKAGNGLTEYVINQRTPVLINGDSREFCGEHGIDHTGSHAYSWLGVPMFYMDRVIGVIALQDYENEAAYDEHHVRLLSTIASQAAVSIQNARFFSDLETSRTELETRLIQLGALQEMGQAISGTLELDAVLDTVLDAVTATIGFSYAVISLVDEEAEEVRAVRGLGVSEEQVSQSRHSLDSEDIMADIVRTGRTEVIDGWDERFDREMFDLYGHADLVRVFAPLMARGKVVGLIEAGYPRTVRAAITQDDIEVLQTFLAQASIAIDNAVLFAEIRRFTEELEHMVESRTQELQDEKNRLEALHTITTELASSLDLDEILLKTVDLASMATGRSLGMILLRDPASGDLVCRAMLDEGNILRPGRQVISLESAGALRRVLEGQEALCLDNVEENPPEEGLPPLPAGTRSIAAVPLVAADAVHGVIVLTHSQPAFFDEDQMRLLSTLGSEVSTAIHNAELYSYINDQALRLAEMLQFQQEEASKSRAILQSIADGVIVVDREEQLILANQAAAEILEIPRDELEAKYMRDLPGLFLPGGVLAQEYRRFELEENRYLNVILADVVTNLGEHLGTVYVLRDITREVEADRTKSEFVSTVSHELRTPLTSIKGYVDLILLGSVGEITPMQQKFLDVVRSNANRLVDLINDLLDISRIETGRMALNPEWVSVFDLVEEVIEAARMELERKQLELSVEVPADLPMVQADRKRVLQVLNNLVSNAYKYTREGGQVQVKVQCTNGYVQVDVSDTGVGISDADLKRLFNRFFRADNPLRDEVGGTGLGLAISKSFVEMHGGEMWVESELDVGSTFSFTLPLSGPKLDAEDEDEQGPVLQSVVETPPQAGETENSYHILVVDDEVHICDLLRYQLEIAGYRVSTALDGEDALTMAWQEQPDLIILDIMMSGMDGFEVLEQLKTNRQTATIPVVISSIIAEEENLLAMGAVDFVPKPLNEIVLQETIERILSMQEDMGTVLVVDDDKDILGWLQRVLTEQGFQVQTAGDGEQALQAVASSPPDLILLDLRMPKMDGPEVIKHLKLDQATQDIPIIVITASSVDKERDRVQILGMGAETFLTKPFTAEQLVQEIEHALRERMEAAKE